MVRPVGVTALPGWPAHPRAAGGACAGRLGLCVGPSRSGSSRREAPGLRRDRGACFSSRPPQPEAVAAAGGGNGRLLSFSAAKVRSRSDSARGGSPGRRTVRAQLSWWSWGKFRVLRRGQAKSAGPSPAAAWSGGGGQGRDRGRGGREGARGLAGVNGRPRSAPGSTGTSFLRVPPSSALSAPGPRRAVRARSPMSEALQLPGWGARPPHNAAGTASGTPAPREARTCNLRLHWTSPPGSRNFGCSVGHSRSTEPANEC